MNRYYLLLLVFCSCIAFTSATAQIPSFERLPAANAQYLDPDRSTSNGAEPRWNPYNAQHMQVAQRAAMDPRATERVVSRYAFLLSLRGDWGAAEAVMSDAARRFPNDPHRLWSEGWTRLNLRDYQGRCVPGSKPKTFTVAVPIGCRIPRQSH